jgi:hypothetical protein
MEKISKEDMHILFRQQLYMNLPDKCYYKETEFYYMPEKPPTTALFPIKFIGQLFNGKEIKNLCIKVPTNIYDISGMD